MGKRRGRPTVRDGDRPGGRAGRQGSRQSRQQGGHGRRDGADRAPRKTVAERLEAGEISRDDAVEKAREVVLRILTAAQKSRRELEQSLARKGYPEDVVVQVLDRFGEVGLVDDATYAETIVRTRHAERGLARRGIAAELRRRGIDEDTAVGALDQLDPDDERAAGARLAAKLVTRTRGLDRQVRVRRAVGSLARKGYPPGLAFELVRDALAAEGEETDDLGYAED
ncbi:regulatory protein RecX [Promicromonospora thailandica]|uniref:Regulatory protein RecX n=1 Tax=Promicromonospora thailandica TaxID=765201 RepID=A0A9X2JUC9_9MICO|nr:regulatory protein RecX [Promicromonospora thailandica]MCP2263896.1 regulatory protein [Promicromonospora thailandica]